MNTSLKKTLCIFALLFTFLTVAAASLNPKPLPKEAPSCSFFEKASCRPIMETKYYYVLLQKDNLHLWTYSSWEKESPIPDGNVLLYSYEEEELHYILRNK